MLFVLRELKGVKFFGVVILIVFDFRMFFNLVEVGVVISIVVVSVVFVSFVIFLNMLLVFFGFYLERKWLG